MIVGVLMVVAGLVIAGIDRPGGGNPFPAIGIIVAVCGGFAFTAEMISRAGHAIGQSGQPELPAPPPVADDTVADPFDQRFPDLVSHRESVLGFPRVLAASRRRQKERR